jgi:hypothetical protein
VTLCIGCSFSAIGGADLGEDVADVAPDGVGVITNPAAIC